MPILPSLVSGKIFDTDKSTVSSATVVLTHSSGELTVLTDSTGFFTLNLGDLTSWNPGDSATITATKLKKGTKTETITLANGGISQDIYLAETSDIDYPTQDRDMYNLINSVLRDYAGNLITTDNALPVKIMNGFGININRQFVQAIAYSGTKQEYIGTAVPGSLKSEAKWMIKKLVYSGDLLTDIKYAGGTDAFEQTWDNRASYDYS